MLPEVMEIADKVDHCDVAGANAIIVKLKEELAEARQDTLTSLLGMRKRTWIPGDTRCNCGHWRYFEEPDGSVPVWHIKALIDAAREGK